MMRARDPLADAAPLIRRVYAYVAYRIGDGPEAEDVTSEVFERAVRYRGSYDAAKGEPVGWLIGIARRCLADGGRRSDLPLEHEDGAGPADVESETMLRLSLAEALERLDDRSRELIAFRYGADLTARQIAAVLGLKTNAVEVALHRALSRLRSDLGGNQDSKVAARLVRDPAPEPGS